MEDRILPLAPAELARHPADAGVVGWLRTGAVERTDADRSPWDIDGHELHVHPDLVERVLAAAVGLPEIERVGAFGCLGLRARGGPLVAIARGTSGLAVRLERLPHGLGPIPAAPAPELGDGWLAIDPWPPEVPLRDAVPLLHRIVEAALLAAADAATGEAAASSAGSADA